MTDTFEVVRVFATDQLALYLCAKSLLEGDGIECLAQNETLKNIDGWPMPGAIDVVLGPAELWVHSDNADRGRLLLSDLTSQATDRFAAVTPLAVNIVSCGSARWPAGW